MNKKGNKNIQSWENILKNSEEQYHRELKQLRRLVKIWRDNETLIRKDSSQASVLLQYALYLEEMNNFDRLKGQYFIKPIKYEQQMKNIKSEKEIFLGITFLEQKEWKINFSKAFIGKLTKCTNQRIVIDVFLKIFITAEGYMNFSGGRINSFKTYERLSKFALRYYTIEIDFDGDLNYLLVSIGTHKVPHYDFNAADGAKIEHFSYIMVITYENIIQSSLFYNQKKMRTIFDTLQNDYEENPRINYSKKELIYAEELMGGKFVYYHSKQRDNQQRGVKICPTLYKQLIPNDLQTEDFNFMIEKFEQYKRRMQFLSHLKLQDEKEKHLKERQCDDEDEDNQESEENMMIEQLQLQTARNQKTQFHHQSKVLQNLEKIKNFKYDLTNQQRSVFYRNGNLIVVGRSGTGKTTCAMLRLYKIELEVKLKEFNSLKNQGKIKQTKSKCLMILIDELKLMKNIFLTFSARLIDQIKKQYDDMLYQIKEKHAEKCEMCKITLIQNRFEDNQEEDPLDKHKKLDEEQQKRVISLDSIKTEDFPGFFTIQNFIRVIDMTISRPFFSQLQEHINPNQANAAIKHAFINYYEYKANAIIKTQTIEAVCIDYNFFYNQIWDDLPKQLTKTTKQFCLLTPSVVWSEIFSIIKGSLNSYLCPGGYISFKMYIEDSQSLFQRQDQKMYEYKTRVYKIFKSYMNWCKNEIGYDLMDVVNHILKEIELYEYSGPKINYMFIDQVQDLTALTTFLISKMVINNVFYCGDTAQAITQGVSFRFEDLKFLFNKDYCKNALKMETPSDIIFLTVNFRSHNFIVQFANSVLLSIENLFPNLINKTKVKERSDLLGPKPFILLNQNRELLFYLICGPLEIRAQQIDGEANLREIIDESEKKERQKFQKKKNKKKKKTKQQKMQQLAEEMQEQDSQEQVETRRFSSEQIIIVRNVEEMKKLPSSLTDGIVFTPQTAKGLQFDEVILYNFFSSCPIYEKWNTLLQHLSPQFTYQNEKQFEEQLRRRSKQEKNKQQPLTDQIKRLLGYDSGKKAYKIWNLKAKESLNGININIYHELASQLKILYTVITRARSIFVIYDQKIPKKLFDLWQFLDLVTLVEEKNASQCLKMVNDYVTKEKHTKYINKDSHWFKAGSKMLARKDYENAKKCFKNIGRIDLVQRIQALQMEIRAQNQLYRINNALKNLPNLSRVDRKITKIKLQKEKKEIFMLYTKAGKIYQKYNRFNDAAEAYFKAEQYQLSLKNYTVIGQNEKIAICCKKLKRYKQAIGIFRQTNDIQGMIGCYIEQKDWIPLFELLIKNKQYINQFDGLNHIALDCIKQVLHQTVRSETIKKKQEYFNEFYGISMQNQLNQKQIFDQRELNNQIRKVTLQSEYYCLKNMQNKLQLEVKRYEDLQSSYHSIKAKMEIFYEEQSSMITKHDQANKEKDNLNSKMQNRQEKLVIEEMKYLPEELIDNQNYLILKQQLSELEQKRINIYAVTQGIKRNLTQIQSEILELEPLEISARNKYQSFTKNYDYKKIEGGLALLSKKLKQIINLHSQQSRNHSEQQRSITNQSSNNDGYDMVSVSDVSEMTEIWGLDDSNIGGLHLFLQDKYDLMKEIDEKLNISSQLMNVNTENTYPVYHHRYIQQRLFKLLIEKSTAQNYGAIVTLRRCDLIEDSMVCLLICDCFKDFICLSPKYILGYLLENSNNFKENRYYENEIYQIDIKKNNENEDQEEQEEQEQELSQNQKFLTSLNNNGLMHKVPRLAFENKFYYQTIMSQVTFGLIIQGYFKEALIFCKPGPACKLAYLYSSYEKLIDSIKLIAQELQIRNLGDKAFLFTEDERIQHFYPQAAVLNIFSIQNIFYAYDECQTEPFLSKKKLSQEIDVEEHFIQIFINFDADKRIQIMRNQKQQSQYEIRRLHLENQYYEDCIRAQKYQKNQLDKINRKEMNLLKNKLTEVIKKLTSLQKQYEQITVKKSKADLELIKTTIPRAQKLNYESSLQQLLFKIDQLAREGKKAESQKLRRKRMNLDEEYKDKRMEEKQAYNNVVMLQKRMDEKYREIGQIKTERYQIHREMQQYEQVIRNLTPKQIEEYYMKFINENKAEIKKNQNQIPIEIFIRDEQKLKDAVVKLLIRQEQSLRHEQKMASLRKKNMSQILNNSNIPNTEHFKFLNLYLQGQLSQKNRKRETNLATIQKIYYNILVDGVNIHELQKRKENKQIADVKICNVIIFYLSYICNESNREDINDFIRNATSTYLTNYQNRMAITEDIKQIKTKIQFYMMKLEQIQPKFRIKANRDYNNNNYNLNNARAELMSSEQMLSQCKGFHSDPRDLFTKFKDTVYQRIKTLKASEVHFMEILFGFFQCRVVRQCELLDFISNQYVLVRHNSIVIEKLLQQKRNIFAYYFDQANQTVLCRFEDVQRIILGFIQNKYDDLSNIEYEMANKENKYVNKRKYMDRQILGEKVRQETLQSRQLLSITQFTKAQEKPFVNSIYDSYYQGDLMMKEIKNYKKEVLEYLLKHKHKNADEYYFATHQLREYSFLQKVFLNIKIFSYQTLMEVKKKKELLRKQFSKYTNQVPKDRK